MRKQFFTRFFFKRVTYSVWLEGRQCIRRYLRQKHFSGYVTVDSGLLSFNEIKNIAESIRHLSQCQHLLYFIHEQTTCEFQLHLQVLLWCTFTGPASSQNQDRLLKVPSISVERLGLAWKGLLRVGVKGRLTLSLSTLRRMKMMSLTLLKWLTLVTDSHADYKSESLVGKKHQILSGHTTQASVASLSSLFVTGLCVYVVYVWKRD